MKTLHPSYQRDLSAAKRVSRVLLSAVEAAEPGWRALELCPVAIASVAGVDRVWLLGALAAIAGEAEYCGSGIVVTFDATTRRLIATRTH